MDPGALEVLGRRHVPSSESASGGSEIDRHVAHRWRHVECRPVETLHRMRLDIPDEARKCVMVRCRATGSVSSRSITSSMFMIGVDLRRGSPASPRAAGAPRTIPIRRSRPGRGAFRETARIPPRNGRDRRRRRSWPAADTRSRASRRTRLKPIWRRATAPATRSSSPPLAAASGGSAVKRDSGPATERSCSMTLSTWRRATVSPSSRPTRRLARYPSSMSPQVERRSGHVLPRLAPVLRHDVEGVTRSLETGRSMWLMSRFQWPLA